MSKNRFTDTQKELRKIYSSQRKRIMKNITKAEKRGYIIPDNIKPKTLNEKGEILQEDIDELIAFTPEKMYELSTYGGELTYGEIISGVEGRNLERRTAQRKAKETTMNSVESFHTIIEEVRERILTLERDIKGFPIIELPPEYRATLLGIFEDNLSAVGEQEYTQYLTQIKDELFDKLRDICEDSNDKVITSSFQEAKELLNMGTPIFSDDESIQLGYYYLDEYGV